MRLSLLDPPAPPAVVRMEGPPEVWHLVCAAQGPLEIGGDGHAIRLEPGKVVLWEPCESLSVAALPDGVPARATVLHLPGAALPLPGEVLRAVSGRPASTGSGPAALLAGFLDRLAVHAPYVEAEHTRWLGTAAVNLATAFLQSEAGPRESAPAQSAASRRDRLLGDIKAYIERHLADADLTPTAIAAANHISLRYLHHLFQRDQRTVGGFLRERRLAHCRADLSDPALSARSVGEIARRRGFRDPAVFSRMFKSAYGVAPGAFREQRLRG
ncbi:helix-turn-helix transcriptional regulator [Streptomyces palmae]|uniref:helix-turn-helix transcriptional regulator n=1 Tax=Streptomyces palmae TaxID=1701085 RepID=UPI0014329707|nr:helix-turn-helix domain-containing protein [Streptomyces palmae]